MDKNLILEKSRIENKDRDLYQREIEIKAGAISARVGALICTIISLLSYGFTKIFFYGPWIIYFTILSSNYIYRYKAQKEKSDLVIFLLYGAMSLLCFVFFVLRLLEYRA